MTADSTGIILHPSVKNTKDRRVRSNTLIILFLVLAIPGCAIPRPVQELAAGAEDVTVSKDFPGENYSVIGPVSGVDGTQCGLQGYKGSFDGAITNLKNNTYDMGGNYAQITRVKEPHWIGPCFNNEYAIEGTAYKKVHEKQAPATESGEERMTKQLRELKKLLDDGILSEKEYEAQKARLLEKGFDQ